MTRSLAVILACGLSVSLPVILAVGCGDDSSDEHDSGHGDDHGDGAPHEHDDADVGPPSKAECPSGSTLTYANFGKEFFSTYCLRCHSANVKGAARMNAPADHNFDTLDEIDLLSKHIDEMAAAGATQTNTTMPPSDPKPSTADRKKLGEWIACGVPE
jgi:hypothetical protein